MLPTVALAEPEEAPSAVDPVKLVHDLDPRVIAVGEEDPRGARRGIGGDHVVRVLETVELLEEDVGGVGRPLHARDVMVARVRVGLDPAGRPARGRDDADADGGVDLADLGVRDGRDLRVAARREVHEREVLHPGGVELPVSEVPAIGAPTQAVAQAELLLVDPVGRAVDAVRTAVARQRRDAQVGQGLHVKIVRVHVGHAGPVRRQRREEQRGRRSGAAELTQRARRAVQHPVIAAGLLAPYFLGVGEDQQRGRVLRPFIFLELEGPGGAWRQQLAGGDQHRPLARRRIDPDDVLDLGRLGVVLEGLRRLQRREGLAILEPIRRPPALRAEFLLRAENPVDAQPSGRGGVT